MLGNVLFEQCVQGIVFDECVNVDSSNHHFEGYVHDHNWPVPKRLTRAVA